MFVGLAIAAFTLIVGLTALWLGVSFAIRPAESKLAMLRPFSLAVILASACAMTSGLAVSFARAADSAQAGASPTPGLLLGGLAEAMLPGAVGFALLAVAWALVGVGMRRQP